MVKSKKTSIVAFIFAVLWFLLTFEGVFFMKKASAESTLTLSANDSAITVTGLDAYVGQNASLVRFKAHQYHGSETFIPEYDGIGDDNARDGYPCGDGTGADRNYYSASQTGLFETEITSGTVVIDRYSDVSGEVGYDKIYDKFYVLKGGNRSGDTFGGGEILVGPVNVTEFPSERTYENTEAQSIKGLEVMNADDGENLGVSHAAVTFDMPGLLTSASASDAIEYTVNGKQYYFSENFIKEYDKKVMANTEAGFKTTFVMVIWRSSIPKAFAEIVHPHNTTSNVSSLSIVAPNMTTQAGVDYLIAMYEFIADRYTREDQKYGQVSYFVIGNETDAAYEWNNMGYLPLDEYMRQYERTVRAAYTAIRKHWSEAGVMISTTHFWNKSTAAQFGLTEYVEKGAFSSRQIIDNFAALAKKCGDFEWELAYHPYRATHMGEPVFWDATNVNEATNDPYTTRKVTPLNIHVLGEYLKKEELLYKGQVRNFYLTESGVASPHEEVQSNGGYNPSNYDPENFPERALNEQAAAYAYTYYSFLFSGAKSYIFHRHTDVIGENGVNIGIWLRSKGSDDLYGKKPVWTVMKYIDTEKSLEVTEPYLQYITLYPNTTPATSWADLIPGFDASKLEKRELPLEENASVSQEKIAPDAYETGFEKNDIDGWQIANRATKAQIFNESTLASSGNNFLMVRYNNTGREGGGYAEKGILKTFETPADFSGMKKFVFAVQVGQLSNVQVNYDIKVRFYSGNHILESKAVISPEKYQTVNVDIENSAWQYFDKVDKIKIWYSVQNNTTQGGMIYFDDIGFVSGGKGCAASVSGSTVAIGTLGTALAMALKRKKRRAE